MAFSLTIVEGKDEGRQFTFDQAEVLIGRTSENDVVLYDPGVSRRHVKIRSDGERYLVQDLGSANGTQLNGVTVEEEELREGDSITVGPVVFSFSANLGLGGDAGGGSTRILGANDLAAMKKAVRKQPVPGDVEIERGTVRRPAAKGIVKAPVGTPSKPGAPKSATLAKHQKKGGIAVAAMPIGPRPNPIVRLKDWFVDSGPIVKFAVFGVLGVAVLGGVLASLPKGNTNTGPRDEGEVFFPLSNTEDQQIYGNGTGVTHLCMNHCKFKFKYQVATGSKAIATLYYYARGIQRPDTVTIDLNTVPIGSLSTTFGDFDRQFSVALKPKYLKPNDDNLVVFTNTRNPKSQEEWAISGLRVETIELPNCAREDCMREAKRLLELCTQKFNQAQYDAVNLFNAWQEGKKARLQLEAVDDKESLEIYNVVKDQVRDIEKALDAECGKQLLTGKKLEDLGRAKDAVASWKNGLRYFPTPEHPCYQKLQDQIGKYE